MPLLIMVVEHPVRHSMGDQIYRTSESFINGRVIEMTIRMKIEVPVDAGHRFNVP